VPIELVQGQFPGLAISNAKIQIRFQIIYTEAILSNSTRKLLWFEISKMLIGLLKYTFIVLFIIIFGKISLLIDPGVILITWI